MLLQVCRLSLLFARLASWHVNCRKRYFLLSLVPLRGPPLLTALPQHHPPTSPNSTASVHTSVYCECVSLRLTCVKLSLSLSCPGIGFSLAAVAYFNPPRWWRAYIIHNYRFHFCLPVIMMAFLDVFSLLFFASNAVFTALLRCCRIVVVVVVYVSYGFLIFNFYDVLMDIFLT